MPDSRDSLASRLLSAGAVDRRAFLARAAATAATLALPRTSGAQQAAAHGPLSRQAASDPLASAALEEVTLDQLAAGLAEGRWTARALVEQYLARIEQVDRQPQGLNSILEINPDALAIADALDEERRTRGPRGPLHGVPILLKDNIGTADRLHTSAGSLALAGSIAPRDAFLVAKLRKAGCIILGKSNMSEWSAARGDGTVGGWSGRGGLTRNPYALDRSAGGSSSGTAAAVSANLVAAAIGTETMGSIVTPASLCGIVGLKPTVGLVSRSGIIPVSFTQDTAGPMCRTVRDAALLLSAIAGLDPDDPATAAAGDGPPLDYAAFLDRDGLRGARIGVARNLFGSSRATIAVMDRAIATMRDAGATIVEDADIENAEAIWTYDAEVLSYELKASLDGYLRSLGARSPVRSLADVIAFNARHGETELEWFGQETFLYAQQKGGIDSAEYREALAMVRTLARERGIDATVRRHKLDAIVAPAASPAWLIDMLAGDNADLGSYVAAAAAGYPSLTVPAGEVSGLPVGILFFGPAWSEGTLLKLGYAFEQRVQARRTPRLAPTIPLAP